MFVEAHPPSVISLMLSGILFVEAQRALLEMAFASLGKPINVLIDLVEGDGELNGSGGSDPSPECQEMLSLRFCG